MTDFKEEDAWGKTWVGNNKGDISNQWGRASVSDCPDQQEESICDETVSTNLEEQEICDETFDGTLTVSPPLASKTRVLEALMAYPIYSGVAALLERRDIYALSLSCGAIFYAFNIENLVSRRAIISRCIQKCHGPYSVKGLPEYIIAPRPSEHHKMIEEGEDMGVQACGRKSCWNDVCKVSYHINSDKRVVC